MNRMEKTTFLVMSALITCLILLATFSFKIPSPFTKGYVHLGDTMIFLGVLVLGKKGGGLAAAVGSALADLLGGYALYIPWTFAIKGLMAFMMGVFIERALSKKKNHVKVFNMPIIEVVGMIVGGIIMIVGYAIAEFVFNGNWVTALLSMGPNTGQFGAGIILAVILATALYNTPAKKYFAYRLDEVQ